MSNANERLINSTIIYMIGGLTSKVLQLLILPIITSFLVASEYGYYDLIITTSSLVAPLVTLQICESMFRSLLDTEEKDRKSIVSTTFIFIVCGIFVLALLLTFIDFFIGLKYNVCLIFLVYVANIIFSFFQKLSRCEKKNKIFAASGVIYTFVMLIGQIISLSMFSLGVNGLLMSIIMAYTVSCCYLYFNLSYTFLIKIESFSFIKLKEMLLYSWPLVANSLAWWMVASSDRYMINFFLGASAVGIYSVASKFSQLLNFFVSVFQLSWQENAIMEKNSIDRDLFYTNTFNSYMRFLLGGYLIVLPLIRICLAHLIAIEYQKGYVYIPILLCGAIFCAFSQFYGSAYLVFKKTGGAFYTTIWAVFVDLIIIFSSIKYIGLFAPALGLAISFAAQWMIRIYQMRKYFMVKIKFTDLLILLISATIITYFYYDNSKIMHYLSLLLGIIIAITFNKNLIVTFLHKLNNKIIK